MLETLGLVSKGTCVQVLVTLWIHGLIVTGRKPPCSFFILMVYTEVTFSSLLILFTFLLVERCSFVTLYTCMSFCFRYMLVVVILILLREILGDILCTRCLVTLVWWDFWDFIPFLVTTIRPLRFWKILNWTRRSVLQYSVFVGLMTALGILIHSSGDGGCSFQVIFQML